MTYLIQLFSAIAIGSIAGFVSIEAVNYAYKFKGHKHIGWIRLLLYMLTAFVVFVAITLLNQLRQDQDDVLLAFIPVVFFICVVPISRSLFGEKRSSRLEIISA